MTPWRIFMLLVGYRSFISAIPAPGLQGRYELFMQEPYFVGLPDHLGHVSYGDPFNYQPIVDVEQQARIEGKPDPRKPKSMTGRDDISKPEFEWAGRHDSVKLKNTAGAVVAVYKENLRTRVAKMPKAGSDATGDVAAKCTEECGQLQSLADQGECAMNCALEGQSELGDIHSELFQGIVNFCHSVDTIYTRFGEVGITNLGGWHNFAKEIENPVLLAAINVPIRGLTINFLEKVQSPIQPLRTLVEKLQKELKPVKEVGVQLVGENSGCNKISLMKPIMTMVNVIAQDAAIADYFVLQGYGFSDMTTKYLDDFPLKKNLAAQHFVYDMLLGTTCGLYLFSAKGQTTDCDQYGGYPVIDMPVPDYLWKEEQQEACLEAKEKSLEKAGGGGGGTDASGGKKTKRQATRKTRKASLRVGRRF